MENVALETPAETTVANEKRSLTWQNWATLVAYVFNIVITYVSLTGVFGETNTDLSRKYQTLITPAGWAFAIWGPIFIGEGVYSIMQMFPKFRGNEAVKVSTPWWIAACTFQVAWTLSFAQEQILLSLICMLGILISLIGLVLSVNRLGLSLQDWATYMAPFSLHLGWILVASNVNVSVQADASEASPGVQVGLAVASCMTVLAAVTFFTVQVREPIVPLVAMWAFIGIYAELGDPQDLNDPSRFNFYAFDQVTLDGLRFAAAFGAVVAGCMGVIALIYRIFGCRTTPVQCS